MPMAGGSKDFAKAGYRFPKPLVNLVGRPMLCWLLDALKLQPVDTVSSAGNLQGRVRAYCLNGFSGDVFLNFDSVFFELWDPSDELRAELSFNLPLIFLRMVEGELENQLSRFNYFYTLL